MYATVSTYWLLGLECGAPDYAEAFETIFLIQKTQCQDNSNACQASKEAIFLNKNYHFDALGRAIKEDHT